MRVMQFIILVLFLEIMAYKKELRLKYKGLRKELSEAELEELSLATANNCIKLPFWDKNYFHVFLAIKELKEINTEYLLHLLAGKDKDIILSKSDFETRKMKHILLTDTTKIKKNEFNIPEPIDGIEVPTSKIEVIFIPLLSFDKFGNRVGYGKGFYDTFLSECNSTVIKVGLSLFEAENQVIDVFDTDVKLDYCITPKQVYTF